MTQAMIDAQRQKWREKKRKYRELVAADPERSAKAKLYERERNRRRKEKGQLKSIADMGKREKKKQRKKWREASMRYYQKKKISKRTEEVINEYTPSSSPFPLEENVEDRIEEVGSRRQQAGRRRQKQNTERKRQEVLALKKKLYLANKNMEKWKKKYHRIVNTIKASPSPRKKVDDLIKRGDVKEVRKILLFGATLTKQIRDNAKNIQTEGEKRNFSKCIKGKFIKKYKFITELGKLGIVSPHIQKSTRDRRKIKKNVHSFRKVVTKFFEDDENSMLAPGKRDCITLNQIKKQKIYLIGNIKDLYKKFISSSSVKLSYSSFARMKPFWVVPQKLSGRETCLCIKHANFKFLFEKLIYLKVGKVKSVSELLKAICRKMNKTCMYGKCSNCVIKLPNFLFSNLDNFNTFYYKWVTKTEDRIGKNKQNIKVKITNKIKVQSSLNSIVTEINTLLPEFCKHSYNIMHQQNSFRLRKSKLKSNEVAILIDFSENYVCKYSQEVQSVHFGASKAQITLHTGVLYTAEKDENVESNTVGFCTISASMRHDPSAIWAHLSPILAMIKEKFPLVDTLHFYSDGPTTQYRNKSNFFLLTQFCKKFEFLNASWNFSEAGHGKGAADGIGGVLKRTCDAKVAGGADITDVVSFIKAVSDIKIKLFQIEEAAINKIEKTLPKTLKPVPGTMKLHQIIWTYLDEESIYLRDLSCDICNLSPNCSHHGMVPNKYAIAIKNTLNNVKTNKICCASCEDILDSDTEEEDLKNVGCDACPRWYHLKCSQFRNEKYEIAAASNFFCDFCRKNSI